MNSGRVPEPWLGVEPRHLATFVSVADAGSFRAAAARLGYVQSAVSQQISQLERALDTHLIDRGQGNRDLVLTPAGQTLLNHARRIVDEVRAACADIAYLAGASPVRVGVEPAATSLVPLLASKLGAVHADAPLSVSEAPAAELPDLVATGTVDVAIGGISSVPSGLSRRVVRTDAWVLVAPRSSELAGRGALSSLSELRGMRLVEDRSHPLPVGALQLGAEQVIACDRLSIGLDLVRAHAGHAILPHMAVPTNDDGIVIIELGELLPPRVISLIWLRARKLPDVTALTEPDGRRDGAVIAVA